MEQEVALLEERCRAPAETPTTGWRLQSTPREDRRGSRSFGARAEEDGLGRSPGGEMPGTIFRFVTRPTREAKGCALSCWQLETQQATCGTAEVSGQRHRSVAKRRTTERQRRLPSSVEPNAGDRLGGLVDPDGKPGGSFSIPLEEPAQSSVL
jgi:hypothetical protein